MKMCSSLLLDHDSSHRGTARRAPTSYVSLNRVLTFHGLCLNPAKLYFHWSREAP
jgi:hypothetical protein